MQRRAQELLADPRAPPAGRLAALDGVRGLAIAAVLLHNLSEYDQGPSGLGKLWRAAAEAGWVGVSLFFVLSGFLITGILLDDRARPNRLKIFYVRRVLRIFPLYYAFLAVYFATVALMGRQDRPVAEQLWFWSYLSNFSMAALVAYPVMGHFWSLAVEEQFYLVWPFFAGRVRNGTLARVAVALVLVGLASRVVMDALRVDDIWIYHATLPRLDGLGVGALVAIAFRSDGWRLRLERALVPLGIGGLVALGGVVLATRGLYRNNALVHTIGYSIVNLACAVLVAAAAGRRAPRWLGHRALVALGTYSYAIYVFHLPIKHGFVAMFGAGAASHSVAADAVTIAGLALAAGLAARASAVLIERPCLRLKERWAPR